MTHKKQWLSSKEVQKTIKIKSCELMHYRLQGKLKFKKEGNAYFYLNESLEELNYFLISIKVTKNTLTFK